MGSLSPAFSSDTFRCAILASERETRGLLAPGKMQEVSFIFSGGRHPYGLSKWDFSQMQAGELEALEKNIGQERDIF